MKLVFRQHSWAATCASKAVLGVVENENEVFSRNQSVPVFGYFRLFRRMSLQAEAYSLRRLYS